jgi:hypothetical protein
MAAQLTETVWNMYLNRRGLIGKIVRDQISREGMTVKEASAQCKLAPATMNRVLAGDPKVTDVSLRQIEGGFGWPLRFFTYILDGDSEKIRRQEWVNPRPDLVQYTLDELAAIEREAAAGGKSQQEHDGDSG